MKKTIILLTSTMLLLFSIVVSHTEEKQKAISLTDAIKIATEKIQGNVIKTELEQDLYEIRIKTTEGKVVEVYVNTLDGKILNRKGISLDEAIAIATKEVPGEVIKVEFERGAYEVKIETEKNQKIEVYIDRRSGVIIKVKVK